MKSSETFTLLNITNEALAVRTIHNTVTTLTTQD